MSSGCRRRGWTLGLWLGLGVGLVPMVSWAQPQPGDAQPAKSLSLLSRGSSLLSLLL